MRQLFLQQIFPALPCIFSRLLIPSSRIWRFPGTHETVASVFICDGFISFAGCFHVRLSVGDGGSNTCVVLCIEAIDRRFDLGHISLFGWASVEDKGCGEIAAVGSKAEGLASAPAESGDKKCSIGCWQLFAVVSGRV